VTARDGGLQISFPPTDSGSPILDYQYELNGSGRWVSAGASTSPLQISGLTNGTEYSVRIRAVSAIDVGPASAPATGTPQAKPGAPTITSVTTGVGSAEVAFTPGYLGGGPASGYEYQLNGGAWTPAGTMTSPISITGLANGTVYAIALRAVNSSGDGAASQPSTITTPDVPGAPTVTSIKADDRSLSIAFTPGSSGGTTVTGYEYQLTSGGPWTAVPASASPIVVTGLTNGTAYDVSVRAINLVGAGAGSTPQAATPATVPGAPTIVGDTVAGSDSQLTAAFTPPTDDGGAAITGYQYSTDGGATWRDRDAGTVASPLVISTLSSDGTTPLENGTTYYVELRAVNAQGAGQASAVATGIASTTPDAPTITAVAPGASTLHVTFTPAANGGAEILRYEYRLNNGNWVYTGTLSNAFDITGLTNGTSYAVSVRAVNANGNGDPSPSVSGTPATVPGQPAITHVTRADKTLLVAVTDAADGGAAISGWEYSTDGGTTWAAADESGGTLTITTVSTNGTTPIANGTSYPITVRAVNSAGTSIASLVTTVGPSAVPATPTVTLTPLDQAINVTFSVASDGGSPITAIEYRLNGGAWIDAGTLSSPFAILGLDNGTPYTVEVRADNAIGAGTASEQATATPAGRPGMPTAVAAVSDTSSADVSWNAPDSDGGAPVSSYVASAYTSLSATTPVATCTTSTTSCSIPGLTNGTTYYVSVVASNATGAGTASGPRVSVTPLARPAAPTLTGLTAGNALLTLAFTAGSAGDKPITGYQYQLNGGAWQDAGSLSSPLTISGLSNGTSYTVALRAVSAAGVGAASTTLTKTPYTYPDAPSPVSITANGTNASAVVAWQAPFNGGSPITSYTATAFTAASAGSQAGTCTTSGALTCTITGLTNGTIYYVSLQAGNAAGLSVRSDPRIAVTPSLYPGAVAAPTGTAGDSQVSLSWTPGSTGGSAITDYTVWYSSGGAYTQFDDGVSTATTATVTGLSNGTPYTFKIYAVNASGTGPASAASSPITPLAPGVVPTASAPVSTVDGFTFDITNYSAGTTYTLTASDGATVSRSGGAVTVSGLAPGAGSTVSIAAAVFGSVTRTLDVNGSALSAGITPTFGAPVRTADGFSFQITNYVPTALYTLSSTNGATVTQIGSHLIVTGLAPGASSDVGVTVTRVGYTDASATQSGAALDAGTAPTFGTVSSTGDGFSFDITNYSAALTYTVDATAGATITRVGSHVVISGLSPGAASTVTVTSSDPNVSIASATVSGSALLAGTSPALSAPVSADGGFSLSITNYDPAVTYTAVATAGDVTISGSHIAVAGLAPGDSSTVTVTAQRTGYADASASAAGSALAVGTVPTFTQPVRTAHGFTFDIDNFDPSAVYAIAAPSGVVVTMDGAHVTVTGMAAGASATISLTVSQTGHLDAQGQITGQALDAVVPTPSPSVPPASQPGATPGPSTDPSGNAAPLGLPSLSQDGGDLISATPLADQLTGSDQPPLTQGTSSDPNGPRSAEPSPAATDSPELSPGSASVTIGGVAHKPRLSRDRTSFEVSAAGLTMRLAVMVDGREIELPAGTVLKVDQAGRFSVTLKGFQPHSRASVTGYSTPIQLDEFTIGADGLGQAQFTLPDAMKPGPHTLVANGTAANGKPATISVGILITEPDTAALAAQRHSVSGSGGAWWWVGGGLLAFLLAAGCLFWFAWRRRRRDDENGNAARA
jgi:titin